MRKVTNYYYNKQCKICLRNDKKCSLGTHYNMVSVCSTCAQHFEYFSINYIYWNDNQCNSNNCQGVQRFDCKRCHYAACLLEGAIWSPNNKPVIDLPKRVKEARNLKKFLNYDFSCCSAIQKTDSEIRNNSWASLLQERKKI